MIYIDFQGGSHGSFLEFVCNKHLANVATEGMPFNAYGASHDKKYLEDIAFVSDHYSTNKKPLHDCKVITIKINHDDLLPLASVSLLRAGDFGIDNDKLEQNTFVKLSNPCYISVLDNINNSFFKDQIKNSYNAIKDPSWPDVNNLADFKSLPLWIQDECTNVHGLQLLVLDQEHPDCPRQVLREFFKIGFKNPESFGFMTAQQKMIYDSTVEVHDFPFGCFYDTDKFLKEIHNVGEFCNLTVNHESDLIDLHKEFLSRQIYKDSKSTCDQLIEDITSGRQIQIPKLDLLCESYITAHLELHYGQEIKYNDTSWFTESSQIWKLIS